MFLVLIAIGAYIYLAFQVLFHGLRFGSFMTSVGIMAVLFIVLIVWSVHHLLTPTKKQKKAMQQLAQRVQAQPQAPAPAAAPIAADPIHHITFRVAGVTFDNEDGTSRQCNLADLKFEEPSGPEDVTFRETTYKGDPAIEVYISNKQVGYVPKTTIPTMLEALSSSSWTVDDLRIIGGGKTEDGRRLSYGAEITGSWS